MSSISLFRSRETRKRTGSSHDADATVDGCAGSARSVSRKQRRCDCPERRERFFGWKYLIDRWVGSLLLVLTAPLTLFLFLLVKLTSPGPGFYRQTRFGLDGKAFEIVKLRSMVQNAEKPGQAVWCVKNDARVTWLGRILRKLHLDELPQLWNVAAGDMSLVGPRPERPPICEKLAEQIDGYYRRVTVKPGVTGLAQINLPPDQTIEDAMRKQVLDLRYIDEADAWLDLRMLLATGLRMLGIRGEVVMRAMRLCRRELIRDRKFVAALSDLSRPSTGQVQLG